MEIRQLSYFKAIIEESSFSHAASRCGITQPSLSQQIKKLEEELGEVLLVRSRSGCQPTSAGVILLEHAARILEQVEATERLFEDRAGQSQGTVSIGAIPTMAPYWLPERIAKARLDFPELQIEIVEAQTADLVDQVLNREICFALVSDLDFPVSGIEEEKIGEEAVLLMTSLDSPYSEVKSVVELDLDSVLSLQRGYCLRGQTLRACRAHDYNPKSRIRCESIETMVGLVEVSMGVAFIPSMAAKAYAHRKVQFKQLQGMEFKRNIKIISLTGKVFNSTEKAFLLNLIR